MNNQKFCPNCGTANELNATFCASCGGKFPEVAPAPAQTPAFTAPVGAINQNGNIFTFLPLICAAVSAIAVFFLPWFEINFFISASYNLFEIIEEVGEDLSIFLISIIIFLVMAVAASVLLIIKKKAKALGVIANVLLIIAALIFIIYVSAEGDGYVDIGFGAILTIISGIAGIVTTSMAKKKLA